MPVSSPCHAVISGIVPCRVAMGHPTVSAGHERHGDTEPVSMSCQSVLCPCGVAKGQYMLQQATSLSTYSHLPWTHIPCSTVRRPCRAAGQHLHLVVSALSCVLWALQGTLLF